MFVFSLDKPNSWKYYEDMNKEISLIPYPLSLESKDGFFKAPENFEELISKVEFITQNKFNDFSLSDNEAYAVEITPEKIKVYSSAKEGAFYAKQVLKQLSLTYKTELPCLVICDKPEYKWRGMMLDTCRAFYSVEFIKKVIDSLAFHRFNKFHWHLTDDQGWRICVPEYPLLTEIGSVRKAHTMPESIEGHYDDPDIPRKYYNDEEITDIINYAKERCIEVIPEIELPGHVSALLAAYPQFGCTGGPYQVENRWGIFPDVLCLGNDEIFKIYDAIFATVERLFPSKYMHIGGDECLPERWKKCPKCQARMKAENLSNASQLQSWATQKMVKLAIAHGKTPIGWDEVLDNTDKIPLPDEVIVQSWRGFEGGERAVKLNHHVIMSPVSHTYMNFKNIASYEEPGRLGITTVEKAYSYTPFTQNMSMEARKLIMGGECNMWTEALPHSKVAEYLMFPRLCAISECLWLPLEKKDFGRFEKNLTAHKRRLYDTGYQYYDGGLK